MKGGRGNNRNRNGKEREGEWETEKSNPTEVTKFFLERGMLSEHWWKWAAF